MTMEKLYPVLPSAPNGDNQDALIRYNRVKQIYEELRLMKQNRKTTYTKYSKAASYLHNASITFGALAVAESGAGIATTLTIIGTPVGLVLTGLGALSGLTAAVLSPIIKQCERKKIKHAKIYSILNTGLTVLDKKISKILDDQEITDDEFNHVIDEYKNIKSMLYEFNVKKLEHDIKKEIGNKLAKDSL